MSIFAAHLIRDCPYRIQSTSRISPASLHAVGCPPGPKCMNASMKLASRRASLRPRRSSLPEGQRFRKRRRLPNALQSNADVCYYWDCWIGKCDTKFPAQLCGGLRRPEESSTLGALQSVLWSRRWIRCRKKPSDFKLAPRGPASGAVLFRRRSSVYYAWQLLARALRLSASRPRQWDIALSTEETR